MGLNLNRRNCYANSINVLLNCYLVQRKLTSGPNVNIAQRMKIENAT